MTFSLLLQCRQTTHWNIHLGKKASALTDKTCSGKKLPTAH
jgi:hypothetical protein